MSALPAGQYLNNRVRGTRARSRTARVPGTCEKKSKINAAHIEKSCTFAANMKKVQSQYQRQRFCLPNLANRDIVITPPRCQFAVNQQFIICLKTPPLTASQGLSAFPMVSGVSGVSGVSEVSEVSEVSGDFH